MPIFSLHWSGKIHVRPHRNFRFTFLLYWILPSMVENIFSYSQSSIFPPSTNLHSKASEYFHRYCRIHVFQNAIHGSWFPSLWWSTFWPLRRATKGKWNYQFIPLRLHYYGRCALILDSVACVIISSEGKRETIKLCWRRTDLSLAICQVFSHFPNASLPPASPHPFLTLTVTYWKRPVARCPLLVSTLFAEW